MVGNGADFLTLYPQPLHKQPIYKLFEFINYVATVKQQLEHTPQVYAILSMQLGMQRESS